MVRHSSRQRQRARPPPLGCAVASGRLRHPPRLAPARRGQPQVVRALEHHALLLYALRALTQRLAPTAHRRHARAESEVAPLHQGRLALPATRRQQTSP
jgi:hypothetical protein